MPGIDPHDLERFVAAQKRDYDLALQELRAGRKRSHWIWYIFPQIDGLGRSATARRYAIQSRAEAEAYLHHPILGPRLRECCEALLTHRSESIGPIMGVTDTLKLRSSMTLFAALSDAHSIYHAVLDAFFDSAPDPLTLSFLKEPK